MKERNRRKTSKVCFDPNAMEKAVGEVLEGQDSIREVCKKYAGLKLKTVATYVKKKKEAHDGHISFTPKYNHRMVFTEQMEALLQQYILQRIRVLSGVSITEFHKKAFELAVANNCNIPDTWRTTQIAEKYWMYSF